MQLSQLRYQVMTHDRLCSVMFMPGSSVIVLWSRPKVSHEVLLGRDTIQDAPEVSKFSPSFVGLQDVNGEW